jgi:predicted RNA-binding Zn-ribbon protein involved in translation (DUF1610 family)
MAALLKCSAEGVDASVLLEKVLGALLRPGTGLLEKYQTSKLNDRESRWKMTNVPKPKKCPNCGHEKILNDPQVSGTPDYYFCEDCQWRVEVSTGRIFSSGLKLSVDRPEKCPSCDSSAIFHDCRVLKHPLAKPYCTECEVPGPLKGYFVCDDCGWGMKAETGEVAYRGDSEKTEKEAVFGETVALEDFGAYIKKSIEFKKLDYRECCMTCKSQIGGLCNRWHPFMFEHGSFDSVCTYHIKK